MTIQIAIAIPAPFVTAQQFADLAKMPLATVKGKIQRGELPIRKKQITGKYDRSTTFINMVALTLEGAKAFNPELNIKDE